MPLTNRMAAEDAQGQFKTAKLTGSRYPSVRARLRVFGAEIDNLVVQRVLDVYNSTRGTQTEHRLKKIGYTSLGAKDLVAVLCKLGRYSDGFHFETIAIHLLARAPRV